MIKKSNGDKASPAKALADDPANGRRIVFKYAVKFATAMPFDTIEAWLDRNCSGPWDLAFGGIDEKLAKKTCTVRFQVEDDKNLFVTNFASGRR